MKDKKKTKAPSVVATVEDAATPEEAPAAAPQMEKKGKGKKGKKK